jgi:hypothetical protein
MNANTKFIYTPTTTILSIGAAVTALPGPVPEPIIWDSKLAKRDCGGNDYICQGGTCYYYYCEYNGQCIYNPAGPC